MRPISPVTLGSPLGRIGWLLDLATFVAAFFLPTGIQNLATRCCSEDQMPPREMPARFRTAAGTPTSRHAAYVMPLRPL